MSFGRELHELLYACDLIKIATLDHVIPKIWSLDISIGLGILLVFITSSYEVLKAITVLVLLGLDHIKCALTVNVELQPVVHPVIIIR